MPDDKTSRPSTQPQKKKKKKKKQKQAASCTPPKDAVPLDSAASAQPPVPTVGPSRPPLPKLKSPPKLDSVKSTRRSRKPPTSLLSLLRRSVGSPVQGFLSQLSAQARESVRWEGALDDPLDEEQRLEMYRTNRRQRYIRHRESKLQEKEQEEEAGS